MKGLGWCSSPRSIKNRRDTFTQINFRHLSQIEPLLLRTWSNLFLEDCGVADRESCRKGAKGHRETGTRGRTTHAGSRDRHPSHTRGSLWRTRHRQKKEILTNEECEGRFPGRTTVTVAPRTPDTSTTEGRGGLGAHERPLY